jgi:tRNA nucleotidyltransferase (CCA-adding enzyme)
MLPTLFKETERLLPPQLSSIISLAAAQAQQLGFRLYLVGGVVRDLMLGRPTMDIDLVVDGDALALAQRLANTSHARLTSHARFSTARLSYPAFTLDLAMARKETYRCPGALPEVRPGSIEEDLFRRDFTINAMAISLNPDSRGKLIDPYGGKPDLEAGVIRILHPDSFTDDATRIWRAIRYEQRLNFRIERTTLRCLRRSLGMLDTISADRLRHEIDRVLKEELPEKILQRAWRLGVLQRLHPSLKADRWLTAKYRLARRAINTNILKTVYLALLACRLDPEECEVFLSRLNFASSVARVLRETVQLYQRCPNISAKGLKPGHVYELVSGYDVTAVNAMTLAASSATVRKRLRLYLDRLRRIRVSLSGRDLRALGVPAGPPVGIMLHELLAARLDGKLKSRRDEENYVRRRLAGLTG